MTSANIHNFARDQNLKDLERAREEYWNVYPQTSPFELRWQVLTVRHSFHVLSGESIAKGMIPAIGPRAVNAPCQIGISKYHFLTASQQGDREWQ